MISVPNGELKGREMRRRERETKQVLQRVPLVLQGSLLPAPSLPFSSLYESPFRSGFKNLTFNVLYHNRNLADQHPRKGPQFHYLFLVLNTLSNSKVFSSSIPVFMKAKGSPVKIPHLLGAACPRLPGHSVP